MKAMYALVLTSVFLMITPVLLQFSDAEEKESNCQCVPFYQCNNKHGKFVIDPRNMKEPTENTTLTDEGRCEDFQVCCELPDTEGEHEQGCGKSNFVKKVIGRIVRKTNTTFGEWPWQGAVLEGTESSNLLFKCGCVLIDEKYVLTVAHCVQQFSRRNPPLYVRLGAWNLAKHEGSLPFQEMKVTRIKIHPGFNNETLFNDIALLKLSTRAKAAFHVGKICLTDHNESHENEVCVVTGWGKEEIIGSRYSPYMRKTFLPILNHTHCQKQLRKTRLGNWFVLHKSFICAGGIEGEDACKGDGGGALACRRKDGTYALLGLVSWGIDCGQAGVPGVYVDVRKFLPWIGKTTKQSTQNIALFGRTRQKKHATNLIETL